MKTVKIRNLTRVQIDWLVARLQGATVAYLVKYFTVSREKGQWLYCESWGASGPILNEHKISRTIDHSGLWVAYSAYNLNDEKQHMQCHHNELVAGLRCYIASKVGEAVEVPDDI